MATSDVTTHICARCALDLPSDRFKTYRGKRESYCIRCVTEYKAEWYARNRERARELAKKWSENNRDRKIRVNRAYYAANKSTILAKQSEYQRKTKELRNSYKLAWRRKNIGKSRSVEQRYRDSNRADCNARIRVWKSANKLALRAHTMNRLATKKNAGGKFTKADVTDLYRLQKGVCACCRTSLKTAFHVDHITPLASGGDNTRHNLQLLCPTCNLKKNKRDPVEFMRSRGFLL